MILLNKKEKELVLKYFPNTKFFRTARGKSNRHHYYMAEEKDQLRFLSGIDKTRKNFHTKKIEIAISASPIVNFVAVKAFKKLLMNNIKYYNGEIGGMRNNGEVLNENEIINSIGLRKFCEYELSQVMKKYKMILK